jgi:hypothetical protein
VFRGLKRNTTADEVAVMLSFYNTVATNFVLSDPSKFRTLAGIFNGEFCFRESATRSFTTVQLQLDLVQVPHIQ